MHAQAVHRHTHACKCMWRLEVDVKYLPQSRLHTSDTVNWKRGHLLELVDQLAGIEMQLDTVVLSFDTQALGIQTPVLVLVRKHLTQKPLPEAPHLSIIHSFIQERLYIVTSNMGNCTKMF